MHIANDVFRNLSVYFYVSYFEPRRILSGRASAAELSQKAS